MKVYNIMDLFSGVGGLSYGFSIMPEFNIVAANEVEEDIAKAYSLNHPSVKMLYGNINKLSKSVLEKVVDVDIDLVLGGPPCQPYSTAGKRDEEDRRAKLFKEYVRVLDILHPKAFIFENVPGIVSMDNGYLFFRIQEEFYNIGYSLKYQILDAADYGVPQHRERVFLVGYRGEDNPYVFPEKTHSDVDQDLKPYVTLKDAIGDLPKLKCGQSSSDYTPHPDNEFLEFVCRENVELTEHDALNHGADLVKIMETLKEGECKEDLPEEIRPKKGFGNIYAKLWWDKPSTTITRNFACPSSQRCIHPDSRSMTIREGARLQSFPDDYKFYGLGDMKRLEIGNAVPPLVSCVLAKQMLKALSE